MRRDARIQHNISAHDRGVATYRSRHPEIYNEVEQHRLRKALAGALAATGSERPRSLDFGTGDGNLAEQLAALGAQVTVADVSPRSVAAVGDRLGLPAERRFVLNGIDLAGLPDQAFDFLGAYSVLHHVPDYLAAARDMVRVLRPGGVLFLDHEAGPAYWAPGPDLQAYRRELTGLQFQARGGSAGRLRRLASPARWMLRLRRLTNPRYQPDGDLHVWPDDHIEWDRLERTLAQAGAPVLRSDDYLLCRGEGPAARLHARYASRCADMRLGIFRREGL